MSLVQRLVSRTFAAGVLSLAVLGAGVVGTGCKHETPASTDMNASLYDRLGGKPAVTKVVDDFVKYAASDPAVNFTRKGEPHEWNASPENVDRLKKHLVQFISMATGGPKTYEGNPDMAAVHKGMNITQAQWDAAVQDLIKALNDNNVPQNLQQELLQVVGSTHDQIVGK